MKARTPLLIAAVAALTACSEYNISEPVSAYGELNPPALDNPTQTDRVVQAAVPEVDVLWTIDNSCSMGDEQAALAANFDAFIGYFVGSGLDYHVGVISTDMDSSTHSGKLREAFGYRYIDDQAERPRELFTAMAEMGTSGSATERGRESIFHALEVHTDGYNAGWQRQSASMHIIVISDEEDDTSEIEYPIKEFGEYLATLKPLAGMTTFNSIVNPRNCSPNCGDGEAGGEYITLTEKVGGIEWDIRRSDWDQLLDQLGMQAAGMKREFFLSQLPDPSTIEVWVEHDGERIDFVAEDDWVYDEVRNSVRFLEYLPDPRAEVFMEYVVLAGQVE